METLEKPTKEKSSISTIIVYVITSLFAIGMVLLICGVRGLLTKKLDTETTIKGLCDAFTISGALTLCFGGLVWVSDKGAFDGFAFSMRLFFTVHFPVIKDTHKGETYADYVERKHKGDGRKKTYAFQIILGASVLLVGVIFLIVYYTL